MARFCTQCGRRLEEGEVCNCTSQGAGQQSYQNQGDGQYYQQPSDQMNQGQQMQGAYDSQTGSDQQSQYGQQDQGQYYQQGQNPYGQQDQSQYYQQGQNPYGQQDQSQYYQQGQNPYGQQDQGQYYQQGQNPYGQQNQGQYYQQGQNPYGQQNQGQYYNQQGYPGGPYGGQGRSREAEWLNEKKNAFVSVTKNMFSEILPILKRPVGRVREIADSNSPAVGLEFMVTKLVMTILVGLLLILKMKSAMGEYASYVKIPYIQLLLIAVIFTIGMDLITALLLKVFAGVFGGSASVPAMISVVGARAMYDSVFILVFGLLFLLSAPAGLFVAAIAAVLTPYIEYGAYQACGRISEDRVAYAYFVTKICMAVITSILAFLLAWGVVQSFVSYAGSLF